MISLFCSLIFITCGEPPPVERIVTATNYNVGVVWQNDDTPCIGASGRNLCEALEDGESVCAMNGVPFGTIVQFEDMPACAIWDRKNSRYDSSWIDIARPKNEIKEARAFGVKRNIKVKIYE